VQKVQGTKAKTVAKGEGVNPEIQVGEDNGGGGRCTGGEDGRRVGREKKRKPHSVARLLEDWMN